MSAGRLILSCVLSLTTLSVLTPAILAQDVAQPEVENSKYQFAGEINANSVYVRSGPGEGYYPTIKLDKGAAITVVGIKFEWLKILPPEGSFSYVAKAYVERTGDGSIGNVTKSDVNVRAGSSLNAMKGSLQTKLNQNDRVVILGEQDEYFKIQPPAGAYLYVNKDFVTPVKAIANNGAAGPTDSAQPQANTPPAGGDSAPAANTGTAVVTETPAPSTQPTDGTQAAAPTTQDSAGQQAQTQFEQLEVRFAEAEKLPLDQQPVKELLAGYEPLANGNLLPESMRRIAAYRVAVLKVRAESQEQLLALKKQQEEFEKKQQASRSERDELQQRIDNSKVKVYAAVGEVRSSSLQQGTEVLYRLTDPANGRTVVYLRSNDPKMTNWIGQFVGVKGDIQNDSQLGLNVITPTAIEPVDPSQVNDSVAAQILPPSLMPKAPSADATNP